jgi:acetylornithine deacetylase/succinyl-diaminopimelate desuccinylase-like protein
VGDALDRWLEELGEFLRIPSVSADPAHADDVRRAAEWVRDFVRAAGGRCDLVERGERPLVVGGLDASSAPERAPTVLLYGHVDVQPADPLDRWLTPPFEPSVRDGYLYARGAADDKGQLYLLLRAVADLAAAGELPVNVRVACDGEEEVGGHAIADFLAADTVGADAALVYDGVMPRRGLPVFAVATRGLVYLHLRLRTGERDLHSGLYGGAALNAAHALVQTLAGLLPRDGRLAEPLRAGLIPPSAEEVASWAALPSGGEELAGEGARPADDRAAEDFYLRTTAEPSLDVHGLAGGSPHLIKTVIPVEAEANLSLRLAPGQRPRELARALEELLRAGAPAGAEVETELLSTAEPARVDPQAPAIKLARQAFARVLGAAPALVRLGGSLPVMAALAGRGIPTVLTGFALADCNAHAPNERLPLDHIPLGVAAAREVLRAWAALG